MMPHAWSYTTCSRLCVEKAELRALFKAHTTSHPKYMTHHTITYAITRVMVIGRRRFRVFVAERAAPAPRAVSLTERRPPPRCARRRRAKTRRPRGACPQRSPTAGHSRWVTSSACVSTFAVMCGVVFNPLDADDIATYAFGVMIL